MERAKRILQNVEDADADMVELYLSEQNTEVMFEDMTDDEIIEDYRLYVDNL